MASRRTTKTILYAAAAALATPSALAARTGIEPLNNILELLSSVFYPSAILDNPTLRIGFFKLLYFFLIFTIINLALKKMSLFKGDDNAKRGATTVAIIIGLIAAFFMPAKASEGVAGFIVTILTLLAPIGLAGYMAYYAMMKLNDNWMKHLLGLLLLFFASVIVGWTMNTIPAPQIAQDLTQTILSYSITVLYILIIVKIIQLIASLAKGAKMPDLSKIKLPGREPKEPKPPKEPEAPATITFKVIGLDQQPLQEAKVELRRKKTVHHRDYTNAQGIAPATGQPFSAKAREYRLRVEYELKDEEEYVQREGTELENGKVIYQYKPLKLAPGANPDRVVQLPVRPRTHVEPPVEGRHALRPHITAAQARGDQLQVRGIVRGHYEDDHATRGEA